ncbi:hypothetical protein CHUAL_003171 [Chamberlinius hualienensis]
MKFRFGFYKHLCCLCFGGKKSNRLKVLLLVISMCFGLYMVHSWQVSSSIKTSLTIQPRINEATRSPHKVILYWTGFFYWPSYGFGFGHQAFLDNKCYQSNCETTSDRTRIAEADAVIFHIRDLNLADLPLVRYYDQRWVFFLYEQPLLTWLDIRPLNNVFNWTMTYRRDSDIPMMAFTTKSLDTTIAPSTNYATGKSKLAAWLVSNCHHAFSHRDRYVDSLKKYIEIDIIGRCGRELPGCYPRGNDVDCYKTLAKTYKFYFSFENAICNDYVTEKWANIVHYNIVPVVMGGADYKSFAPPHSYISVHDFKSPRHLAEYLMLLDSNDTLYNEYLAWKSSCEVYDNSKLFCDLCEKLHDSSLPPKSYSNIHKWWVEMGNCSGVFELPPNEHSLFINYFDYIVDNLIFSFGSSIYGVMTRIWF